MRDIGNKLVRLLLLEFINVAECDKVHWQGRLDVGSRPTDSIFSKMI